MLDETIYKSIQEQDSKVYEYLMDKYSKLLWVVVSGILKNAGTKEDIEDCVADCFIYLWENPEKYDIARGTIKTFLCVVARSKAIDAIRKLSKVTYIAYDENLDGSEEDIQNHFVNKEQVKEVLSALDKLKPIEKKIFILRYFYEIKPREIAISMGLGVKEVTNKLYCCKKYLYNTMGVDL